MQTPKTRKSLAQWSKTYAGKKFYTSIAFLALPIVLLIVFTFIPALDMALFSFQDRDKFGATVFRIVYKLGLYRSILVPIILNVGTDIISIYIFIQFLGQISFSLDESAIMDGASYPRVYFSIILPNLKPAIATVLIIKFVGIYNDFYTPKLYMPDDDHVVISTVLYNLMNATTVQWQVVFAGIIICIIPTLVIFLFLQKYIYSGLVSGAVKE